MPGPKMGERPPDFNERLVMESPTFKKWALLTDGQKLRYACRDFIKGHGEDEERLMRRIMIARRNNLRDHEILKQARAQIDNNNGNADDDVNNSDSDSAADSSTAAAAAAAAAKKQKRTAKVKKEISDKEVVASIATKRKRCAAAHSMTDEELRNEMDTPAIEATRSYKAWMALHDEREFTYNQKYIKGRSGHDWLLRKNIWRRMRYRRHNKCMVEKLKNEIDIDGTCPAPIPPVIGSSTTQDNMHDDVSYNPSMDMNAAMTATQIVDQSLLAAGSESSNMKNEDDENLHAAVVEAAAAAVAAAESYVNQARESETAEIMSSYAHRSRTKIEDSSDNVGIPPSVHNPIISDQQDTSNHSDTLGDHHTPNPLVDFDGDALDVAAKLAAAASAQICSLDDGADEKKDCYEI